MPQNPNNRQPISILVDHTVIWMVSSCPVISESSRHFINPLVIAPSTLITIGITVTFIFHVFFFQCFRKVQVLILPFAFFLLLSCGQLKMQSPLFGRFSFFCWLSLGLVVWPRLDGPFVSQNLREFCASHSPGWILSGAYIICSYVQIETSCTIPSGSPSPLRHV